MAGISTRTVSDFEVGRHWPRDLANISVAVGKPAEELEEYAIEYDREHGGHRHRSRARAARIRELENQVARGEQARRELDDLLASD